jgi:DNA (cytosine-5)-methyltransferase 1
MRWKLVGNAVCVPMMEWVGHRLKSPGHYDRARDVIWDGTGVWPEAAWGSNGRINKSPASNWPLATSTPTLSEFLRHKTKSLSARATNGFLLRALSSGLRFEDAFIPDVQHHLQTVLDAD